MLQDDLAANHLVVTTLASHYFEWEHRIYKDIGVTLDPNNFYWYGWPLQQVYDYQGDLCLENECLQNYPQSQWLTVLKKEMALLRTLAQTA